MNTQFVNENRIHPSILFLVNTDNYSSNNNGNGDKINIDVWIKMLKEHYEKLAATYQKNGMVKEAEVFSKVFEQFATLQKMINKQEKAKKPNISR